MNQFAKVRYIQRLRRCELSPTILKNWVKWTKIWFFLHKTVVGLRRTFIFHSRSNEPYFIISDSIKMSTFTAYGFSVVEKAALGLCTTLPKNSG